MSESLTAIPASAARALDLRAEFSAFLTYFARLGGTIREVAAGGGPHALLDLQSIGHVMHTFAMVSDALDAGDPREIQFVCTSHIHMLEAWRGQSHNDAFGQAICEAFERCGDGELLHEGSVLLRTIVTKAHELTGDLPEHTHAVHVLTRRAGG